MKDSFILLVYSQAHSSLDPLRLQAQNVPPRVAAKFYIAVVQAVLLYGSKTWVLSATALASLEGFHIRAAYRMAVSEA